jgi:hypothetical protein
MRRAFALLPFLLVPLSGVCQTFEQPTCSIYNVPPTGPFGFTDGDPQQHINGEHFDTGSQSGTCTYSGGYTNANTPVPCSVVCKTSIVDTAADTGVTVPFTHVIATAPVIGIAESNGAQISCNSQFVMAVRSCIGSCAFGVTISGVGPNGFGGSIAFSPPTTPLWTGKVHQNTNTCDAKNEPVCILDPLTEPPPNSEDGYWSWDNTTCSWTWHRLGSTPIIIDTDGKGFHLTSAAGGIRWDFYANHHPIQIAWTEAGSTNGWLALPNADGQITSARQLFSNVASQATGADSDLNGFRALATYDTNGDGVIDAKDNPWWGQLRVWIDTNHDGVSQPNELHTLPSLGITSIALAYTSSPKTDRFGNQYRLKGTLKGDQRDQVDRVIYDVTLVTAKGTATASAVRQ